MHKYIFFISLSFIINTVVFSQPVSDFYITNPSYCLNQRLSIINNSTGASDYVWDFCSGELNTIPKLQTVATSRSYTNVGGIKSIIEQGKTYLFVVTREISGGKVYRLEIADNNVVKSDLIVSSELSQPWDIDIIKDHRGNWFGFIGSEQEGYGLTRLSFGDNLENIPEIDNVGNFDQGSSRIRGVSIFNIDGIYKVLLTFQGSRKVLSVNFLNDLAGSTLSYLEFDLDGRLSIPVDTDFVFHNGSWYGYTLEFSNNNLFRANYGSDFSTRPTDVNPVLLHKNNLGSRLEAIHFEDTVYVHVSMFRNDSLRFYQLSAPDSPMEANYIEDLSLRGTEITKIYDGHSFRYYTFNGGTLTEIKYTSECKSSKLSSEEANPKDIFYDSAGTFKIRLLSNVKDSRYSYKTGLVTVTNNRAPTLSFTPTTLCQSSPVAFTSESDGAGLSYSWDFGDTGTAAEANPAHTYATPGDYEVTLSVDDGTCGNFVRDTITVYPEPEPDFTTPGGVVCTNQPVTFNNTTPGDFGGNITWQWEINEEPQSGEQNLNLTFASGGDKAIKLIAILPGCSVEVEKNFTGIQEGPVPRFTFDDSCPGEEIPFNNESVGEHLQYRWDFGYDCCATVENPIRSFPEPGVFDITLTLTDTVTGCVTPLTKPITIYTVPDALFEADLACEQLETQFNDLSTIELYNLDSWEWNFGDGSPTAEEQNPQHVYSRSGTYSVTLKATSDAGCTDSVTQLVNVKPAPKADFEYDKKCLGEPVTFTDTSVPVGGQAITSREWSIAGMFTTEESPAFTFDIPLPYKASLTVSSENRCISTYETIVEIPPAPVIDFTVDNNCENEKTILTESVSIEGDETEDLSWFLAGSPVVGAGSQAILNLSAGDYPIRLEISTVNGCNYAFEKIITVHPPPVAAFAASATFGAPPLKVDFTDSSVRAVSYRWDFADGNASSEENPTHEFEDTGEYDVSLIVTSLENCKDTTVSRITVLTPQQDLEIINLSLVSSVLGNKISITLRNNGTVTIDSVQVALDLGGQLIVHEILSVNLLLNSSATTQLPLQLTNKRLDYICVDVAPFTETVETDLSNNSKCLNFGGDPVIFAVPYPNPVTNGQLNMDIIAENEGEVVITMMNNIGKIVFSSTKKLLAGSNRLMLVTDHLFEGLYLINVEHAGISKLYRIAVIR